MKAIFEEKNREYVETTNAFVPWFPKQRPEARR